MSAPSEDAIQIGVNLPARAVNTSAGGPFPPTSPGRPAALSSVPDRIVGELFTTGLALQRLRDESTDPDQDHLLDLALIHLDAAIHEVREVIWASTRGAETLTRRESTECGNHW